MEPVQEEDKVKKKTELFLNTPGVCFLCVQANETDDDGACKPVKDATAGIINLTSICRYLNINQCSLLLTSLQNEDGVANMEHLEQDLCTFLVKLCPKCVELTRKLIDMLVQLDKAKLMVNFYFQSFHKLLEEGRMNNNTDNSLEAKLVKLLREETKDKSFKILEKAEAAMPQLILSKFQMPPPPPPVSSKTCCLPPPSSEPPPIPSSSTGSSSLSIKNLLRHLVTSNSVPTSTSQDFCKFKLYRCPYCTKILGLSKFALHLSNLHSDKVLSSHFPKTSPPSELICREVLYTHVLAKAAKIASSTSPRFGCHLCGISYSNSNLLKHHFLITHTDNLIEAIKNVKKVQKKRRKKIREKEPTKKDTNPVTKLIRNLLRANVIEDPSRGEADNNHPQFVKRYQCPFCRKCPVYSKYCRHLANRHPDMLLAHINPSIDKLKNVNPNSFSLLCRKTLKAEVSLSVKRIQGGGPSKLWCHLCSRKYSKAQNLKHHFVVSHTDHLCKQLIKIENGPMVKLGAMQDKQRKKMVIKKYVPLNVKPLNDKQRRKRVIKKVKPVKVKLLKKKGLRRQPTSMEEKTCKICRVTFANFYKMQRHQVSLHPDQLFLMCKPSGMGGDQFKGNCKELFRREVGGATYGKPGDKIFKCGYCPGGRTSYKGQIDLIGHLAYQHRQEMEGKLRKYMEINGSQFNGEEDGGDEMVIEEEDASEFDVKPDGGEFDELVYPEMVLDELIGKEMENNEEDDNPEQIKIPDNQSEPQVIKMEVNHAFILDDY